MDSCCLSHSLAMAIWTVLLPTKRESVPVASPVHHLPNARRK